jgi:MFS transporter, OFA family, oxalate/formate antiporter
MSSTTSIGVSSQSASGEIRAGTPRGSSFLANPWVQLVAGIICMGMVANLQYGWTVFVNPIDAKYHWGKAAIQVAFTLFVLFETWLVPFEAYLADRFGPRPLVLVGAILVMVSWILNSKASSLAALYVAGAIGGIATGLVYGTCIGNAVKWFEQRRGLAAGLTAAGFGAGAAITVVPLTRSLATRGYEATFFMFAIIQGLVILFAALPLEKPPKIFMNAPRAKLRVIYSKVDSTPQQTLRSAAFWIMYVDFILVAASGLMATAQLAPIATGFGIAKSPVTLLGYTLPALTFALSLNNIMNGISRPLFGWISDWMGREMTMFITFLAEGIGIFCLDKYGRSPMGFVILAGLVFFAWGNIFSIFPALTSDHFGRKFASTNYALLYTAKGCAAFFVPIGSYLALKTGSWSTTLTVAAVANIIAAFLMITFLRPMRQRELQRQEARLSTAS